MMRSLVCVAAFAALAGSASAQLVLPTTGGANSNFIPFGTGVAATPVNNSTQHQVFRADLFGTDPIEITRIAFSPGIAGSYLGSVTINLGYTNRTPFTAPPTGLDIPVAGGGGAPNAAGAVTQFYSNPAYAATITAIGHEAWNEFFFPGSFVYDPAQGNLLVEIVASATFGQSLDLHVSRAAGSAESSRSYATIRFGNATSTTTATRMQFTFVPATGCYPDCNEDNALTIADFSCFQAAFVGGNLAYADCNEDNALTIADFACFQSAFVAGCP